MTELVAARTREMSPGRRMAFTLVLPSLAAVRSRLWMIGPPLILSALAVLLAPHVQNPTWRATAMVSISRAVPNFDRVRPANSALVASSDPDRFMTTQVSLARSPALAARVVVAAGVPAVTPNRFLRHSRAKPQADADILNLSVSYPKAAAAVRLANAYGIEFRRYKSDRDVAAIKKVLRAIQARINSLRDRRLTGSAGYDALVWKQVHLQTEVNLLSNNVRVLQLAGGASSFRPHALRNGILGGVLGALLGVALVVAVAAVRSKPR